MVQFAGTYKLDRNENFDGYLKAIGIPDEFIEKAQQGGTDITVTVEGNVYKFDDGTKETLVKVGEEWSEDIFVTTLSNRAEKDGDTITIHSTTADGRSGTRAYEFSDDGYVAVLTFGDVVGKRHYVRV